MYFCFQLIQFVLSFFQSCRFKQVGRRNLVMTLADISIPTELRRDQNSLLSDTATGGSAAGNSMGQSTTTVTWLSSSRPNTSLLCGELTSSSRDPTLSLSDMASTVTSVSAASSGTTDTSAYHSDMSSPNSPFATTTDTDSHSQVGNHYILYS